METLKKFGITLLIFGFILSGFNNDISPGSRDTCEPCREDIDCKSGSCKGFYNSSGAYLRCAGYNTQSCIVTTFNPYY